MSTTLHGTVTRTYYSDAQFTAGVLTTDDGDRVRFRGKFYAAEGDRLAAVGHWTVDPKYGHQFEIQQLDYDLPQTREGLIQYLAKHPAFTGIGERTAVKIVDTLRDGEDLATVLRDRPDALVAAGVPRKTVNTLADVWTRHAGENAVRSYLAGFGLTPHQMDILLTKFGTSIVSMLKHDPYLLIKHLSGYGFKKVDQIALKLGVPKAHPGRIEAAIAYCLVEQVGNGHTWTSGAELVDQANEILTIDTLDSRDLIQQAGQRLLAQGDILAERVAVSLPSLHQDEQYIHHLFAAHAWQSPAHDIPTTDEEGLGPDQQEAFATALTSRMAVISGGAGVGKTFTVARLARRFLEAGLSIALCAPTGKAAKRIEQLLGRHDVDLKASTIHRLLGYNGMRFGDAQITDDVVIVDEVSMVDVRLMAELLRHIDLEQTQLILVGDHNQLPPVGPGNVLRDIIQHQLVPTTVMTQVHRQAGVLKTNSMRVLEGVVSPSVEDDQSRWILIDRFRDAHVIQNYVRDLMLDHIPARLGFDPVRDVQIITPEHRGVLGTRSLNAMMQYLLSGQVEGRFTVGDKVIQTRNDYELGVMNGTIGFVKEIDKKGVVVAFEGAGRIAMEWSKAKALELAFVLTCHKAQGSEFPCCVVLCHKSHFFADRNWLYTAVTRASHTCILIGDSYGLRRAARQVRNLSRRTLLSRWATQKQHIEVPEVMS